jgi:hypothetical protein
MTEPRRKAKKVKKILEHKDISLTDTTHSMKSHIIVNTVDNPEIQTNMTYTTEHACPTDRVVAERVSRRLCIDAPPWPEPSRSSMT